MNIKTNTEYIYDIHTYVYSTLLYFFLVNFPRILGYSFTFEKKKNIREKFRFIVISIIRRIAFYYIDIAFINMMCLYPSLSKYKDTMLWMATNIGIVHYIYNTFSTFISPQQISIMKRIGSSAMLLTVTLISVSFVLCFYIEYRQSFALEIFEKLCLKYATKLNFVGTKYNYLLHLYMYITNHIMNIWSISYVKQLSVFILLIPEMVFRFLADYLYYLTLYILRQQSSNNRLFTT